MLTLFVEVHRVREEGDPEDSGASSVERRSHCPHLPVRSLALVFSSLPYAWATPLISSQNTGHVRVPRDHRTNAQGAEHSRPKRGRGCPSGASHPELITSAGAPRSPKLRIASRHCAHQKGHSRCAQRRQSHRALRGLHSATDSRSLAPGIRAGRSALFSVSGAHFHSRHARLLSVQHSALPVATSHGPDTRKDGVSVHRVI